MNDPIATSVLGMIVGFLTGIVAIAFGVYIHHTLRDEWFHFTDRDGDTLHVQRSRVFSIDGDIDKSIPTAPYRLWVRSSAEGEAFAHMTREQAEEVEKQLGFIVWENKNVF